MLSILACILLKNALYSQLSINGATCVNLNTSTPYQYMVSGIPFSGPTMTWCVSGGRISFSSSGGGTLNGCISGTSQPVVYVTWTSSTGSISLTTSNPAGNASKSVTVAPTFTGGTISNPTQTITYNTTPPQDILCSPAQGGCGSYTYQWQQSTDAVTYTNVPGQTSQNFTFTAPLTTTTYYRRRVTEVLSGTQIYSSNFATIMVTPQLNASTAGPTNQNIFSGMAPSLLNSGPASGGNCSSNFIYQWQDSIAGGSFQNIPGATSAYSFSPPTLTQTTWYRKRVICGSETIYTNVVSATIVPPLGSGGTISPANIRIAKGASPGRLTGSTPVGGICSAYIYRWERKLIDGMWETIQGATGKDYTPGSISATTYFRRHITCGAEAYYSAEAVVSVPTDPGTISGGLSSIAAGSSPGNLSSTAPANGDCGGNYIYRWQRSVNGTLFEDIPGANGSAYTVPALYATTWYRCKYVCNSDSVYSNVRQIVVYQPLQAGSITTTSFSAAYNSTPATIFAESSTGGNCDSYLYQWQRSENNILFENVPTSGTSANYSFSQPQTQSYYYRRRTICGGDTVYTNAITVSIAFNPGALSSPQNVAPNAPIASLAVSNTGGGEPGASYSYQWEYSNDEINWTVIAGVNTNTYTPSPPTETRYYRVRVSPTNGQPMYVNTVKIKVEGPISTLLPASGNITPTQTVVPMPAYPAGLTTQNLNYIRTRVITRPITNINVANTLTDPFDVAQTTEFFDGLGRPIQTVAKNATPAGKDIIATTWYDALGRIQYKYLPYIDNNSSGDFRGNAHTAQPAFYNAQFTSQESFYYSKTVFEASPLNRVLQESAPGIGWTGIAKGVRVAERVNRSEEGVRMWQMSALIGSVPTSTAAYATGQLLVIETTDEAGNKVIEFKNNEGLLLLKKVQLSDTYTEAHSGWLCTYYIYDGFNRLRWVLQPKAVEWLAANNWNLSANINLQNELCFRYEFDARGRMVVKKVPGAAEAWMVYDNRDRLVMTQDGNLRAPATKRWLVTVYDAFNRPANGPG